MQADTFFVAIIVLLVFTYGGQYFSEKAMAKLTAEEKAAALDSTALYRKYRLIPLLVLAGIAFYASDYILPAVIAYFVLIYGYVYRQFHAVDLPDNYRRAYLVSSGFSAIGLLLFFGIIYAT